VEPTQFSLDFLQLLNVAGDLIIQGELAVANGPHWLDILTNLQVSTNVANTIKRVADRRAVSVNLVYAGPVSRGNQVYSAGTYFIEFVAFMQGAANDDVAPLLTKLNDTNAFQREFQKTFPKELGMRVSVSDYPTAKIIGAVTSTVATSVNVQTLDSSDDDDSSLSTPGVALIVAFSILFVGVAGYVGYNHFKRGHSDIHFIQATKKVEVVNPTYTGE